MVRAMVAWNSGLELPTGLDRGTSSARLLLLTYLYKAPNLNP